MYGPVAERSKAGAERMTWCPAVVRRENNARAFASAQPSSLDCMIRRDGTSSLGAGAATLPQARSAAKASRNNIMETNLEVQQSWQSDFLHAIIIKCIDSSFEIDLSPSVQLFATRFENVITALESLGVMMQGLVSTNIVSEQPCFNDGLVFSR